MNSFLFFFLAVFHVCPVLGKCDKDICVTVELSKNVINIGHQGTYELFHTYLGGRKLRSYSERVENEPMRTSKTTSFPYHVPKCENRDEWCFKSPGYKHNAVNPGSYKQGYTVDLKMDFDRKDEFRRLGKFQSDQDLHDFLKETLKNGWYRLIHGRQFHGVKFTDGAHANSCEHILGRGSVPWEEERELCHELCTDLGCKKTCWLNEHTPHMHCSSNSVFATVPKRMLLVFQKPNGDWLGYIQIQLSAHTKEYHANQYHCSPGVKHFFEALRLIPNLNVAFGLASLACNAAETFSQRQKSLEVPDNVLFLPKDTIVGENFDPGSFNAVDSSSSYYECNKCWPLQFSNDTEAETGYSFPLTEEGSREGNHCNLCFAMEEILSEKVNFGKEINLDCQTLGNYTISVSNLLKLLPLEEKNQLKDAQNTCMRSNEISERNNNSDNKEEKLGAATAAGVTFGASAVLFGCIGFVVYRKMLRQTKANHGVTDPVIESFKA